MNTPQKQAAKKRQPIPYRLLILCQLAIVGLGACRKQPVAPIADKCAYPAVSPGPVHLLMGNPSAAKAGTSQPGNYLMEKPRYALSYNRPKLHANWVAWHLAGGDLGPAARQDDFRPDPALPAGWLAARPPDYTGSGFDRGHLCPSADRTATDTDNSSTFLMTNILPQSPDLNRNTWESLESHCRQLVRSGSELYIYAGGFGSTGTGSLGTAQTVKGRINVPAACWKVVLVLPEGQDDVKRVRGVAPAIAVWMENRQGLDNGWRAYITTVDEVEKRTGYDFLNSLPVCVQDSIEAVTYR